jgi:hypothetical protein
MEDPSNLISRTAHFGAVLFSDGFHSLCQASFGWFDKSDSVSSKSSIYFLEQLLPETYGPNTIIIPEF